MHPEHQDLLQFLYQFPIGVIAMDEAGVVTLMNPGASQLLSTEVDEHETVNEPLPILARLVPELITKLLSDPDQLGMISTGRGQIVDCRDGTTRLSVTAHRVRPGHIIVSLIDVSEERRILNEHRARAMRLQRALLGSVDPTDLELSVAYIPAHRGDLSGGDWYDVIRLGQDRVALVVGDVVGHDLEASATMGQLRAIVRAFAVMNDDPGSVLERTNAIARTIHAARAATIHYAVLDQSNSTVTYASAGHPPPLVIRPDGTAELLSGGRQPALAVVDGGGHQTATTHLSADDILILYTDGLVERRNESLDDGFRRLQEVGQELRSIPSMDELVSRLTHMMLADTDQGDDVCVVAIRHSRHET